jgi:hypothetical protein
VVARGNLPVRAVALFRAAPRFGLGLGVLWLLASCGRSYAGPSEDLEVGGKRGVAGVVGAASGEGGQAWASRGGTGGSEQGGAGGRGALGGAGVRASAGVGGAGVSGDGGTPASGGVGDASGAGAGGEWVTGCDPVGAWSANLERCEGSFVHRATALACALPPRDETFTELPPDAGTESEVPEWCDSTTACGLRVDECTRDADCGAGAYCVRRVDDDAFDEIYYVYHECFAACVTDADCSGGEICACDHRMQNATRDTISVGVCTPATCSTDADCGERNLCVAPLNIADLWDLEIRAFSAFHCQGERDECRGTDDCPRADGCDVNDCSYVGERFTCTRSEYCDY